MSGQDHDNDFGPSIRKPDQLHHREHPLANISLPTTQTINVAADVVKQKISESEIANFEPVEDFWAQALNECDSENMKTGLWAKAYSETGGDERLAKATYMRLRAAQLQAQYLENEQALARDKELQAEKESRQAQELATAELLAKMSEAQRAEALLPKGRCPSCDAVIPLISEECPKCKALFTPDAAWKIKPLSRI